MPRPARGTSTDELPPLRSKCAAPPRTRTSSLVVRSARRPHAPVDRPEHRGHRGPFTDARGLARGPGPIAPGAPVVYRIDLAPGTGGRLTARAHVNGVKARLTLLDARGQILVQSDAQSVGVADPAIDLHIQAGSANLTPYSYYLEVESLGGRGDFSLTTALTETTAPFATIPSPDSPLDEARMALGDFNHDHVADLVTHAGVFLATRDGAFQKAPSSAALGPRNDIVAIVTGDFNGDGLTDVAFADQNLDQVRVMLARIDGTFDAAVTAADGLGATALAVGKFTGDHRDDLAVAQITGNVTILGRGDDGTFEALDTIPVGDSPSAVVVGNFDGNDQPDLAVADQGSGDVNVLLGQSGGKFLAAPAIPAGFNAPLALATGDFDHNGSTDLAVAESGSAKNDVRILLNAGNGTFTDGPKVPFTYTLFTISSADLDGDGRFDLIVSESSLLPASGTIWVVPGRADGTFGNAVAVQAGLPSGMVAAADLNGDGRPDLVLSQYFTGDVSVLLQDGAGAYVPSTPPNLTPTAVADVNNDGALDSIAGDGVHLGAGDGTLRPTPVELPLALGVVISAIVPGDFNGDGKPDLAVTDFLSSRLTVLLGNGDGSFHDSGSYATGRRPDAVAAGDFNGDGLIDLAVANFFSGDVTVLLGDGRGSFRDAGSLLVGRRPDAIVSADFNGDGKPDLAVADYATGSVTVLSGDGQGSFRQSGVVGVGIGPDALVSADFNGDGKPDLAVALAGALPRTGGVVVLYGKADGTFAAATPAAQGKVITPKSLTLADFNGDGRPDLAVADFYSSTALVLLNNGGGFDAAAPVGFVQSPTSVAAGDFDGDGRPDLVGDRPGRRRDGGPVRQRRRHVPNPEPEPRRSAPIRCRPGGLQRRRVHRPRHRQRILRRRLGASRRR